MQPHYSQSCRENGIHVHISLILRSTCNPAPGANQSFTSGLARGDRDGDGGIPIFVQILYTRIVTKTITYLNIILQLQIPDTQNPWQCLIQYNLRISLNCRESQLNLFAMFSLMAAADNLQYFTVRPSVSNLDLSGRLSYKPNYSDNFSHDHFFSVL